MLASTTPNASIFPPTRTQFIPFQVRKDSWSFPVAVCRDSLLHKCGSTECYEKCSASGTYDGGETQLGQDETKCIDNCAAKFLEVRLPCLLGPSNPNPRMMFSIMFPFHWHSTKFCRPDGGHGDLVAVIGRCWCPGCVDIVIPPTLRHR